MLYPMFLGARDVQVFLAPGTWTWPGDVSSVELFAVGGGGSGGVGGNPTNGSGSGGGGRVLHQNVPVSGPVPIVIGAGGVFSPTPEQGAVGGSTFFGTLEIGGGGGGGNAPPSLPAALGQNFAPSEGGGAGGVFQAPGAVQFSTDGAFGAPASRQMGGGARGSAILNQTISSAAPSAFRLFGGVGFQGFGGGGARGSSFPLSSAEQQLHVGVDGGGSDANPTVRGNGKPNTGGGGRGSRAAHAPAGSGGSGIVYVVVR